jgi:hypothetical protein
MPLGELLRNPVKETLARDEVVSSLTVRLVRGIEIVDLSFPEAQSLNGS